MTLNTPNARRAVETAGMTEETWNQRRALLAAAFNPAGTREGDQALRAAKIEYVTWEDALAAVSAAAGGLEYVGGDSIRIEYEWAFSISCTLYVDRDYCFGERNVVTLPNGARLRVAGSKAKVRVNWSSAPRSLAQSAACVALYGQVVAVAQMAEQALGGGHYLTRDQWAELAEQSARTPEDVAAERERREEG